MPTYSALTTLPGEDVAQGLAAAMERMDPEPTGVGVFEIEDGSGLWEVGGYFLEPPDQVMLEVLATAFGAKPFALSELPEVDWVAHVRRELSPVDAGRFFVFGSHDADKVPGGRVPLQIEATVAFGTGHHGTTLGCLLAYDRLLTAGENKAMLDPFSPVNEKHVKLAQSMLAQIHQQFIAVVKQGRGKRLKETPETFSGLFWNGEEAIKLGLADQLGNLDYVAREVVKAEEVIDYTPRDNVAERLAKRFGAAMGAGVVKALRELPRLN